MQNTKDRLSHNFTITAGTDEDNPADHQNITEAARDMRDRKLQADIELAMQQIAQVSCQGADKSRGNEEVVLRLLQSVFNGHKPYMTTRLRREMEQVSTQRDSRTSLRIKSGKAFACQKTREQRDAEEARKRRAERRARHESRLRREMRAYLITQQAEKSLLERAVRTRAPAGGVASAR